MIARDLAEGLVARHALHRGGAPLDRSAGVIMSLHGRGGDAAGMLDLAEVLARPDLTVLAPEAPGRSWYPERFVAPLAANQPWLDRALGQVAGVLDDLSAAGVPDGRVVLMGFSQGACLALETALRRPRRYGGVLAFAGGYIGPMAEVRAAQGLLDGVPVLLACAEQDGHIPAPRVRETAELMTAMGAVVDLRLRPGAHHGIDDDGVSRARAMLAGLSD